VAVDAGGTGSAGADGREGWTRLTGSLPDPVNPADRDDLLWKEFQAQFAWYDRAATRNRYGYQGLRLMAVVVGAAVTVLAAVGAAPALTASLAAVVVVAEGSQQLFQFHANWIEYRAVAETLRQHGFLYAAEAGPYAGTGRRVALVEVMREVIAKEHTSWASTMRQAWAPRRDDEPAPLRPGGSALDDGSLAAASPTAPPGTAASRHGSGGSGT
jgi:hypothetical protein